MNRVFKTEVIVNRQYLESIKAPDRSTWMNASNKDVLAMWASQQTAYKLEDLDIEAWNTSDSSYGWDIYFLDSSNPLVIRNI